MQLRFCVFLPFHWICELTCFINILQLRFCLFQPLEDWSTQNVIDWMAALNLYRYAELFRDKKITGRDLIHMNEDSLLVSKTS